MPAIADWFAVDIRDGTGRVQRVALAHKDPKKIKMGKELEKLFPFDPGAPSGLPKVLRTGLPEFYPYLSPESLKAVAKNDAQRKALDKLNLTALMCIPIVIKGECIGAIEFIYAESKRQFSDADFQMAQELGISAAIAIERSLLYHELKNKQERLDQPCV